MCEPMSIVASVLAVAGGVMSHMQASAQADAQYDYQKAQLKASHEAQKINAESAIREQGESSKAERIAEMQEQATTSQNIIDLQREAMRAKGTAAASSQAAGENFNMLMREYDQIKAQQKDVHQEQLKMSKVQREIAVRGAHDRADSRIKGARSYVPSATSYPSWGVTGLGIGSNLANINKGHINDYFKKDG